MMQETAGAALELPGTNSHALAVSLRRRVCDTNVARLPRDRLPPVRSSSHAIVR